MNFYKYRNKAVNFLDSPSKPILSLSSIDAFEDETIIIECSSDDANPKPVLTIYKAGVKLADGEVGNKAIHNLQLERQMNGDSIICVANSSNKQKHNYIRTSDTETLNVLCRLNFQIYFIFLQ